MVMDGCWSAMQTVALMVHEACKRRKWGPVWRLVVIQEQPWSWMVAGQQGETLAVIGGFKSPMQSLHGHGCLLVNDGEQWL